MNSNNGSQLSFADFVAAVQPTGAISRFPSLGGSADVHMYTIYMNGEVGKALPAHAQEHSFKDVTVQALTEKLQLNPLSARDNLKVAELVAVRSSWMSSVLEQNLGQGQHSPEVLADYEALSKGMSHPWIAQEIEKQRELSQKLGSSLARSGVAKDVVPKEVSVGKVMAQDADFTMQSTQDGEIVTHENRRLNALPAVGETAMVSYYRGAGQVVEGQAKFSDPFVDIKTDELAVRVTSDKMKEPQTVLFNNVQSYSQFVKAHGLEENLVQKAFDVRALRPKKEFSPPERTPVKLPYIDTESNCLAVAYKEAGITYTALFQDAQSMSALAREFGLGAKAVAKAHDLMADLHELQRVGGMDQERSERQSEMDIKAALKSMDYGLADVSGASDRQYMGPIVAKSALHVAQDIGRRQIVIHDIRKLDKAPEVGDRMNIQFKGGRGVAADMVKAPERGMGR